MRSHARRRLVALAAVAAALVPGGYAPASASAAETTPPGQEEVTLPALPLVIGEDNPCTKASSKVAESRSWAASTLGLSRAHQLSQGSGTTVAVVDTGVGSGIPALAGRITAPSGSGKDCVGHGSFTAGLIAAAPVKGSGVLGVAPGAHILALAGTDARGVPSAERVALAIRTAATKGAEVIYVGVTLRTGKTEITAAVEYAAERDALVVAPAAPDAVADPPGPNEEPLPALPSWPAAVPGVLSVVDFGPTGGRPQEAPPAYRPDLAAPGIELVSTGPSGSGHYIGSGSSLAAACTAGAAALVRAHHPEMTAEEVAQQLLRTAYPADVPRLDPYAAVSLVPADGTEVRSPGVQQAVPDLPSPADSQPRGRALTVAGVCLAVVLLVGAAGAVLPRGRARRWRPPGR